MAESTHSHSSSSSSHHHHHHKMDGASKFKRKQLKAIEMRKKIAKYGLWAAYALAVIMAIAVCVVYYID